MYRIHAILRGLILFPILFSCQKATVSSGSFLVVHASPGLGAVDLYMDASAFTSSPLAYASHTDYKPLPAGSHLMKVRAAGTTNSLFEVNMTTAADVSQSLFLYNRPSNLEVFAVEDLFIAPGSGKVGLRFFQLSTSFPLIDLGILSGGTYTPLFTARTVETSSTVPGHAVFTPVNAGTYSWQIRVNGAGTELLTVNNINLQEGKCYTLFTKGISGNTETPLGIGVIAHN